MSSGFAMIGVEEGALLEHAPEHGCLASGEGDEGLGVALSLAPLAVVVGARERIAAHGGTEGGHVEDTLEVLAGAIPLSAQFANAIANDGDALFPAIALAPRAALLAALYSAIPALIVAYAWLFLFE